MSGKKLHKNDSREESTDIAIRVEHYEAETDASINVYAYYPQHAFDLDDRDPLYCFITRLTVIGTATAPDQRAGDIYQFVIYGDEAPSQYLQVKLADAQARDDQGARQYRTYRGVQVPVYKLPHGLGVIEKERGERRWKAWLNVLPRMVSDLLIVLGSGKALYISFEERKHDRMRWVRRFSLQTVEPTKE